MKTVAVVPAAGVGNRMGGSTRKQMLRIQGIPILEYTLKALSACELIDGIVLMAHAEDIPYLQDERQIGQAFPKILAVLAGGNQRQDSVYNALEFLDKREPNPEWVVIHDGVRPFVSQACLLDTIQSAYRWDAAIAAVPVIDTVKHVDAREQWITNTPDRRSLWAAQTPQAFAFPIVREAYQRAREEGFCGTDDASLVERIGVKVRLAQGHYDNIKITNPADLIVGESLLAARGGSER